MEKISLSFKVDQKVKEALDDLAAADNRSLSNYVINLILRHLEEKGIDWRKETEKKTKR